MPLWLAIGICTLAWSSGAFFGAGVSGRGASAFAMVRRPTQQARDDKARREASDRRHGTILRMLSFATLAVMVWLVASLVLAEASPSPWLQLVSPQAGS